MFDRPTAKLAALVAGASIALTSPLASAQNEEEVLVAFSYAGMDNMFNDPNDAALKEALDTIVPRFMELRSSDLPFAPDLQQIPPEMISSIQSLVGAPMHFVVTSTGIDPETEAPQFNVLLSWDMDQQAATEMHNTVQMVAGMAPQDLGLEESNRWAGMTQFLTPMGPLTFGPRQANDGWRYEILFGADVKPDAMRGMLPSAPRGVRQLASGVIDFEALTPISSMGAGFLAMMSPQGEQMVQRFKDQGLLGEGAIRVELTSWTDGTTNSTEVVSKHARNFSDALMMADTVLTPADLAIVPADATAAYVVKWAPQKVVESMLEQAKMSMPGAEEEIDEVFDEIEAQTGIDIMGDLLPSIGDTMAMYFSDSTGGGSLLSGVIAVKASDKEKLNGIIQRIEGMATELSSQPEFEGRGLVGFRAVHSEYNGNPMVTYRIAGLPIPIAPSMTVVGDWFVMGMTPQAAMGAAEQTGRRNGRGLLDNPRFAAAYDAQPDTVAVAFVDTERTLSDGVGVVGLLAEALGNAVSSPNAEGKAMGSIMPSIAQMKRGCQPMIQQTFWRGDDLVQHSTTDASALVTISGLLGVGDTAPLVTGMVIGAGLGTAIAEQQGGYSGGWDEQWEDDWDDDWEDEPQEDPEY